MEGGGPNSQTQINANDLIIGGGYPGLGDNLFFSHLPRIAKESKKYNKVYIYNAIPERNIGSMQLVWGDNPFVDGFTNLFGRAPYTLSLPLDLRDMNLLDFVMLGYGLDDGTRFHEPEIYYKPKFRAEYHKVIFDPNWFSCVGNINALDIETYFKTNGITIDAVLKKRNDKALHNYDKDTEVIDTPTLYDFCDLIYSAKKLYCLTTGTASLAAALRKPCIVLYGEGIGGGRELDS